ncbi:MAG: hypothetical protein RR653_11065 [Clostridia bacterium]
MVINESRRSRAHFDLPLVLMVFALAAFGVLSVAVATFDTSSKTESNFCSTTSSPRTMACAKRSFFWYRLW